MSEGFRPPSRSESLGMRWHGYGSVMSKLNPPRCVVRDDAGNLLREIPTPDGSFYVSTPEYTAAGLAFTVRTESDVATFVLPLQS